MFVIYKFTQDSSLKVKSEKYTNGEFVECKELLPKEEASLFESQIVNRVPIAPAADDNPFLNQKMGGDSAEVSKMLETLVQQSQQHQPP